MNHAGTAWRLHLRLDTWLFIQGAAVKQAIVFLLDGTPVALYLGNTLCFQKVNTRNIIKIGPNTTVFTSTVYKYMGELNIRVK